MEELWVNEHDLYDGSQLRPLYAYMTHGLSGTSIIGWRGPCDIPDANIIDGEDLRDGARICGGDMLHFIVELFGSSLETAIGFQRLLVTIARDTVNQLSHHKDLGQLRRIGDDLFFGDGKFNISIASSSTVSSMIHIAFNVTTEGTPVQTVGLEDLGVDENQFSKVFLGAACKEWRSIQRAKTKVRPL